MRSRLARGVAAFSLVLILAGLAPGRAGGKEPEFVTGSGTSYAQVIRVGPTAGQLSLAPVFGLSLADYVNTVGRGQTTVADWAGIGVAERSLPDNTPFVKVSSTEKDSEKGEHMTVGGQSDGTTGGGIAELFARATDYPSGESRFRLTTFAIPGLIEARSAESHARAGVVKENIRQAIAESEIGSLSIAGGAVVLKGLRWTSVQETGGSKKVHGAFTIEGVSIAGTPLPMPQGSDLAAVIDPINTALAPTGLVVSLPTIDRNGGQSGVTPLSIDIKNSPLGRQFLAPILDAVRPVREPVADAFIDIAKQLEAGGFPADLSVGLLLADLTLGIASGSSQLHLEFGGVTAFTEGQVFESPFGKGITFNPPNVSPSRTVFKPGKPGTPGTPGTEPPSDEGVLAVAPGTQTRTVPGDKGGVAVAVGLIGLGVAIGLAVADWLRMRSTKRAVS